MSVWFVTPAWQREELTALCLDQRLAVISWLAEYGIEAHGVVVADDGNVDVALARGFDVVEQSNDYLGRKWNDGIEHAIHRGAEWVVPIGSDSWIDPAFFLNLPSPRYTRTSGLYAPVTADRLATCYVRSRVPAGPYVLHRSLLERCGNRPCREEENRFTDSSMIAGLGAIRWQSHDLHPLQYIGFRVPPLMTPYGSLLRWKTAEYTDPWDRLAGVYPVELVERARLLLAGVPA